MKKHNLFKIIGIVILAYCILTWIIPASYYSGGVQDLGRYPIGLFNIINIPIQTLGYFSAVFLFILVVGAFYGVLDATGLYRKTLDVLVKKMKKQKLVWLIVITFVIAALSSVVGLEVGMFIVFPFVISLVILLGYDKLTALASTLGATIAGMVGSTYAYSMYGVNNSILGLTFKDGIWIKLILFVLSFGLLVLFMILHNKKAKKVKKDEKTEDKFIPDVKEARKVGCKKVWPIILIVSLCFVIILVAGLGWSDAFGITWFTDIYSKIIAWKIGDFAIMEKLLNGFTAFGTWNGPTRYIYYSGVIIIATIPLAIVYKVKFDEYLKSIFNGAKEYIEAAFLVIFANVILVIVSSFPIYLTIAEFVTKSKFNVATTGVMTLFGSGLYVDMYYYPQYALQYFAGMKSVDTTILNVLFVSLYSVAMLVVPTSVLMLATLSTTDTKYKDWLKFIWKLFLSLVIVVFAVLAIAFVI